MSALPKLLLVDDDDALREMVATLTAATFDIVGEAVDGAEALELVEELQPDLVLMDIEMPVMDGLEATKQITSKFPGVMVVMLTSKSSLDTMREALAAGARDFVSKPFEGQDLLQTLTIAADYQRRQRALHGEAVALDTVPIPRPEENPGAGIWAFARATGGTGQSTLVLGLANELLHQGRDVVVIDAHQVFGHLRFFLRLPKANFDFSDLSETTENAVDFFPTHSSGLRILGPPDDLVAGSTLDAGKLAAQLLEVARQADYVLFDLPAGIPDAYAPILDAARYLFVVSNGNPGAMKSNRDLIELFQQLGYTGEKLRPVMTGHLAGERVKGEFNTVLDDLGTEIDALLPDDYEAAEQAMIQGQPITRIEPKSDYARAAREYALRLLELPPEAGHGGDSEGNSLIGRLFGSLVS